MNNKPSPYPTRWIKKMILQSFPFLCCFFLLSILDKQKVPEQVLRRSLSDNNYFFKKDNLVPAADKIEGSNLPYLVVPLIGEEIEKKEDGVLVEYHPSHLRKSKIILLSDHKVDAAEYLSRSLPDTIQVYKGENRSWKLLGDRLEAVKDYFLYLRYPQINCRKLKRMGGTISCIKREGDTNSMDGHKYVCMDPAMMLAGNQRNPKGCLTLSFGTNIDTSFDEAMSQLPCEVHMYDIIDYKQYLPFDNDKMYFHVEGLAGSKRTNFYKNINLSIEMDTLRGHVTKNNQSSRLIHVLKVDIEDGEWDTFKDITKDPIFDAVGQIALEVHAVDVVRDLNKTWSMHLPEDKWLQAVQDRYDVLRAIEGRGFRRVLYWDNFKEEYPYFDEDGISYQTCGELLYINTNWYNSVFKKQLASRGYNFLIGT